MKFSRELNKTERKQLQELSKTLSENSKSNVRTFLVITLAIAAFCLFMYFKEGTVIISLVTFGIYVLIALWVYFESYIKNNRRKKSIQQTLENNSVDITRIETKRFFQLDEADDEGYYYLFELADKRTISIGGQDFHPSRKFPNSCFEVAIAKDNKNEITLFERYDLGDKIKPEKRINKQEKWRLLESLNYPNPEEFEIVDRSLDMIESHILSEH